jgi:antibiotic biosynthesis monooxygenase (ABM) superfamily enzyme
MITRIWHGWTNLKNEKAYERLLREEIFVHIMEKKIPGFRKIELLKRNQLSEIEFITIMWFDSIENIKAFAGEDYTRAVVPQKAQDLLLRYDRVSQHYEVIESKVS